MSKALYLHTLDDKPAFFDGNQVVFCNPHLRRPMPLCASLAQLKREQNASVKYRIANKMTASIRDYGYIRLSEPSHAN